ncbi:hypothetical protein SOVF_187410, partial [Spinacia oleracea]
LFIAILKLKQLHPHSTVISIGILGNCYCYRGRIDFGFSLLGKRLKLGDFPDSVIFNTLINGFIHNDKLLGSCKFVGSNCQAWFPTYCFYLFCYGQRETPNAITFTTLIDGLCKASRFKLAHELFREMRVHGISPNVFTYVSLLDGLCKSARLVEAVALLENIEDNGVKPTIVIYSILIDSLCETQRLEDASDFFSDLVLKGLQPNLVIFTTMIKGFMREAIQLLRIMEDGCSPNVVVTYNMIVRGYFLIKDLSNALYYCELMVSKGFEG